MKTLQKKIKLSDNDSAKVKKWAEHIENKSTTIVLLCHLLRLSGEPYPDFVKLINNIREGFKNIDEVERELLDHLTDEWSLVLNEQNDATSFDYFCDHMMWDINESKLLDKFDKGHITINEWSEAQAKLDDEYEAKLEKAVA